MRNVADTPRLLANQAADSQPGFSYEEFRKELLLLLGNASVDEVVELLNRHGIGELILSGSSLSIDAFITVAMALPQSGVTRVRLASCGITDNYPVAYLLDERSTLAALDLSSNQLTSRSAKFIGSAIGRNGKLVCLDLAYNQLDHTAYCSIMRYVCAPHGKQPANQTLQVISFEGNCDGKMFAPLYEHLRTGGNRTPANEAAWKDFASLGEPQRLTLLRLPNTGVMPNDPALAKLASDTSLTLDLGNSFVTTIAATTAVTTAVSATRPKIDPHTGGVIVQTSGTGLVTTTTTTATTSVSVTNSGPKRAGNTGAASPAKMKYKDKLNAWASAAGDAPGAKEAVERIREWLRRRDISRELCLDFLILTSLPPLPKSVCKLDVRNNKLTALPELPPSLAQLIASANELTDLPQQPLPCLISLNLTDNLIAQVPTSVTSLGALKYLDMDQNKLTVFPQQLPPLLEGICLGYNQIARFPKDVVWPDSLTWVNLVGNPACPSDADMLRMPDRCEVWTDQGTLKRVGKKVKKPKL
jgi:Leucine-rich repeat (LRR) protein